MNEEKLFQEIEKLKLEIAELKESKSGNIRNFIKRSLTKMNVIIGISITTVNSSLIVYAATITKPHGNFLSGTVISSGDVNDTFDTLYTESNDQDNRIAALEGFGHWSKNGSDLYYDSGNVAYFIKSTFS